MSIAFKNGTKVKITDHGQTYSSWTEMASRLSATNFINNKHLPNGTEGVILNSAITKEITLYLIEDENGFQVIMNSKGFQVLPDEIKKEKKITKKETKQMADGGVVGKVTAAGKKVVGAQKAMAKTAATLEAARIFNNQLAKVASKKLPTLVRGYADTPVGRAVMANLILVGIETTMPHVGETDVRKQVARAAVVESYGVLMQSFKLEDMLTELFEMPALRGLTEKIGLTDEE